MGIGGLFSSKEDLLAVDIGSSSVKLVELDTTTTPYTLLNVAESALAPDTFVNNSIVKPENVSAKIAELLEEKDFDADKAVVSMPGPSVFTKRMTMPKLSYSELKACLEMETANFLPPSVGSVKIDFHIIGEKSKNNYDLLVVAVKDEIVDSYIDAVSEAGLDVVLVDVDYFALQNCFELAYPELLSKTVTLIDMGSRYSGINICKEGQSLFTGDMTLGGKTFSEALVQELGGSFEDAERQKHGESVGSADAELVLEVLHKKAERVAAELNRQLSMFWNASGAEGGIDSIFMTGGASLVPSLLEEISDKTGVPCERIDPLRGLKIDHDLDAAYLDEKRRAKLAIAVGMGIRHVGDRFDKDR